jgi:hypothetical protein
MWLRHFSGHKQRQSLMGRISACRDRDRPIPDIYWAHLETVCEQKRFKRFHGKMTKASKAPVDPVARSQKRAAKILKRRAREDKALRQIGIDPRVVVTRTVEYTYDAIDNKRLDEFYASKEWKLMRYEALRLHGGRCQCCGASPAEGKRLNVDHVKPLRVFWELRLEISNLQVLCEDCNVGKGARHADDWRPDVTDHH